MLNKKNLPLYIALCIPVVMIVIIAAAIYLPGLGKKPQYNFIYATGENVDYYYYGSDFIYVVRDDKVVKVDRTPNPNAPRPINNNQNIVEPKLYLYDVVKNQSTELTLFQTQQYTLNTSNTSPDGFTVERGNYSDGGFPFDGGSGDYNHWYLKGHNRSRQLNLALSGFDIYNNFQFLGWVK